MHEHAADVESDFSAIHRIGDPYALPPQRFIDLAVRLGYYSGAVRGILQHEADPDGNTPAPAADRVVDSSPTMLQADPILAGVIDYG